MAPWLAPPSSLAPGQRRGRARSLSPWCLLALLWALSGMADAQIGSVRSRAAAPISPLPPNVLVILADDIGVDLVGVYAAQYGPGVVPPCTPNLDAFATSAVRFTNAWTNPVCSPTRAQILTGRRSRRSGIGNITHWALPNRWGLQPGIETIAQVLTPYAKVALGKWHLTDPVLGITHPRDVAGFDRYYGSLWNLDGPNSMSYADWEKTALGPGFTNQFQVFTYATTDTTDDALNLMGTLPEPWFIYLAYNSSHSPLNCPKLLGFDPNLCATTCTLGWCAGCDPNGTLCNQYGPVPCATRAMTEAMDAEIGLLLASVDPGDTAVAFLGDNGTSPESVLAPFRPRRSKGTVYQGGINVPLMVRAPGTIPGVCNELVSATDLFATVADLAGITLSPDPLRDSVSLCQYVAPWSCPSGATPRTYVYSEYFTPNFIPDAQGDPPPGYSAQFHRRAIRNDRYKLIEQRQSSGIRLDLFHLADAPPQDPALGPDPFELNNLMLDPASWSVEVQNAFTELSNELAANHPPLPVDLPTPTVVKEAAIQTDGVSETPSCDEQQIELLYSQTGSIASIARAFLDFDISAIAPTATILEVRLKVAILSGAASPTTSVQVLPLSGQTSLYACDALFHTLDGETPYVTSPGWTAGGTLKEIALGAQAVADVQAALSTGLFSLGLKLEQENPAGADAIALYPVAGQLEHRIEITFTRP